MSRAGHGIRNARYRRTPKGAYCRHKINARQRGVPFQLTFRQWLAIWCLSGKWKQRGDKQHHFVMCRHMDAGAYAVGNVYIATNAHNLGESLWTRKARAPAAPDLTP